MREKSSKPQEIRYKEHFNELMSLELENCQEYQLNEMEKLINESKLQEICFVTTNKQLFQQLEGKELN